MTVSRPFLRLLTRCFVWSLAVAGTVGYSQDAAPSALLRAMKAELVRSIEAFKGQPTPPYFLSYEITDDRTVGVNGSFGKITASNEDHRRQPDIDLHVGDYQLDNTHAVRGGFPDLSFFNRISMVLVPLEDDPVALRTVLWYHTDQRYKAAVGDYALDNSNFLSLNFGQGRKNNGGANLPLDLERRETAG